MSYTKFTRHGSPYCTRRLKYFQDHFRWRSYSVLHHEFELHRIFSDTYRKDLSLRGAYTSGLTIPKGKKPVGTNASNIHPTRIIYEGDTRGLVNMHLSNTYLSLTMKDLNTENPPSGLSKIWHHARRPSNYCLHLHIQPDWLPIPIAMHIPCTLTAGILTSASSMGSFLAERVLTWFKDSAVTEEGCWRSGLILQTGRGGEVGHMRGRDIQVMLHNGGSGWGESFKELQEGEVPYYCHGRRMVGRIPVFQSCTYYNIHDHQRRKETLRAHTMLKAIKPKHRTLFFRTVAVEI